MSYKLYDDWKNNFTGKVGVGEGSSTIYTKIRQLIPSQFKLIIRSTFLFIPRINQKIQKLENSIDILKKENEELWLSSNIIKTKHFTLNFDKKILPFVSRNKHGKSSTYIDLSEDKIIYITGVGETFYSKIDDVINSENLITKPIKNNLSDIISSSHFWNIEKSSKYSEEMSIKDILIHNEKIYVSYSREVVKECFNTSVLIADFNLINLKFKNFFTYPDCQSGMGKKSVFGRGGGGRIYPYKNNKLLFSIGDTGSLRAQEKDFLLGKIVEIDITSKVHEILSLGHRNPQGLLYLPKKDMIFSSEHGSKDGGEFNLIEKNNNYGWPISSYGKGPQLYQNHQDHGFTEPLHYFIPSVAPSELVYVSSNFSEKWKNDILLTTLSGTYGYGKSIYRFKMTDDFRNISEIEKIKIGDRMRDIKYEPLNNIFLVILEDSNSLGLIYR